VDKRVRQSKAAKKKTFIPYLHLCSKRGRINPLVHTGPFKGDIRAAKKE